METLPSGIVYRYWPVDQPRATILLIHGLGEHSGRYQHVAEAFNAKGFTVLAPDHLGHGESPGTRVFVEQFDDYLTGVRECRAIIDQQCPGVPCFVLGHSMGGLIAGRLLLEDQQQYRGALLSGPAFAAEAPPSGLVMFIGRLLAKIAPKAGMIALDASGVSRDPQVVAAYNADPLVNHGKITAALGVALFDAMAEVMSRAAEIKLPLLVMHGDADAMAAPKGSEQFAAAVSSSDKTLTLLPGLYHEIFNEPEGANIIAAYAEWIESRL
jgi:alpha-beta hydrolase superfamily lysophospholipase